MQSQTFSIVNLAKPTYGDEEFYERWEAIAPVVGSDTGKETARILVVDQYTEVNRELMERLPNVRFICSATTGHTHLKHIPEGVEVISLQGERGFLKKIHSVSEFTVHLMLSLMKEKSPMKRAKGKQIGIIGNGRVGKKVARVCAALGMKTLLYDFDNNKAWLEYIFSSADVISIHLSEAPQNNKMINEALIKRMKPGSIFINTARASLVDEVALAAKARKDSILVALDVCDEPTLFSGGWASITHHIAGRSVEDRILCDQFIINKLTKRMEIYGFDPRTSKKTFTD